ncbi:MAG: LytR/AlgR family response regulator transcription factor [Bacteroidota bacterium]
MRLVIIEDEPLVAKDLQNRITRIAPDAQVVATISSVAQARQWFQTNPPPDLILSDIQLSDGISFDIFESLHLTCPVIFTTAYDAYAIRAFKLNSIDYLLKPIDGEELQRALHKYKSLTSEQVLGDQLKTLLQNWGKDEKKYKTRFLTVQRNSLVPVVEDEIGLFHKEELIYIHTLANGKLISEHQTLDEIESLVDPARFYRVNRQYIIHIQSVARIKTTHKGLSVQLKPPFNFELDISREKATAFKKWMEG